MEGFFTDVELTPRTEEGLASFCQRCGLFRSCRTARVPPAGGGRRRILIVAGVPMSDDDAGMAHLRARLDKAGVSLDKDCWLASAVSCAPDDCRNPTGDEIASCNKRLWKTIRELKPKVMILLGDVALESFLLGRWKKSVGGIGQWRGFAVPDHEAGCWVAPIHHPNHVLACAAKSKSGDDVSEVVFGEDLAKALRIAKDDPPMPKADAIDHVEVITSSREACLALNACKAKLIAFDYETTGIKPLSLPNHRVISCGVAESADKAYAFMLDDETRSHLFPLLRNTQVRKIAANMKFEELWTRFTYDGDGVLGWKWDTVLAAHVIDNRSGICGVKFQAYVNFGELGYNDAAEDYIKSRPDGYNRMEDMPKVQLLTYNAMDALLEYRIAMAQRSIINSMEGVDL